MITIKLINLLIYSNGLYIMIAKKFKKSYLNVLKLFFFHKYINLNFLILHFDFSQELVFQRKDFLFFINSIFYIMTVLHHALF